MRFSSAASDSGIEKGLNDVDDQVQQDKEHCQNQDRALQEWQITLKDCRIQKKSGTRPGEDGLDQNGTAQQITQLQTKRSSKVIRSLG